LSHHGVGHTGDQVRGARPVRSHAYSWFAGYSGESVGHEGGCLLVTNRYEAQLFSTIHPVEHLDHARAYQSEDLAYPELYERFINRVSCRNGRHLYSSRE
jgi:hypothetical protein